MDSSNDTQNTWRNNLKIFLSMLSTAVVFGTIFHNVGYNNATNDATREKLQLMTRLNKERDDANLKRLIEENLGGRADQERADQCLKEQGILRDEIILLKAEIMVLRGG